MSKLFYKNEGNPVLKIARVNCCTCSIGETNINCKNTFQWHCRQHRTSKIIRMSKNVCSKIDFVRVSVPVTVSLYFWSASFNDNTTQYYTDVIWLCIFSVLFCSSNFNESNPFEIKIHFQSLLQNTSLRPVCAALRNNYVKCMFMCPWTPLKHNCYLQVNTTFWSQNWINATLRWPFTVAYFSQSCTTTTSDSYSAVTKGEHKRVPETF